MGVANGAGGKGKTDRRVWLVRIALVLLTGGIFAQTLGFGFVDLDDGAYVTQNPYVRGLSKQGIAWAWSSTRAVANWHPLTWMSLQFDAQLWGTWPGGYHATNVLLHALNALLLFACMRGATGSLWRSAFVAALFAVHPLHVESVAWVSERKDVLSSLFGLAALWAYLQHVNRREPGWMFLTGFLLILSLLSKQMLVTFPFALLLLDYWPLGRLSELPPRERWKTLVREKAGLLVIAVAFCVIAVVAQASGEAVQSTAKFSIPVRVGNAIIAYGGYLLQMLVPIRLAVFYPHPGSGLSVFQVLLAGVAIGVITWGTWRQRSTRPYLLVGWLWYLGTLVPVIGLVQVGSQQMADRYTYLPLIGPFFALTWLARDLASRRGATRVLGGVGIVLVGILSVLAFRQTRTWRNSFTLFEHAVAVTSRNAFCENNLGMVLERSGQVPEARKHFERALVFDPKSVSALCNLATLVQSENDLPRARELLDRALAIEPKNGETSRLMGSLLLAEGKPEKAVEYFQRAIDLAPTELEPRENLANLYRAMGKPEEAMAQLRKCQKLAPANPEIWNTMAATMVDLGKPTEAEAMFLKALDLNPNFERARTNLGVLRHGLGDFEGAIDHFRISLKLSPSNPQVIENLSGALINSAREAAKNRLLPEARTMLEEAVDLTPKSFFAHHNLARVMSDMGAEGLARRHFEAALSPESDKRRAQPADIAICHFELGRMLAVRDNYDEAEPHFKAALEIVPDFEVAKLSLEGARRIRKKLQEEQAAEKAQEK